jgi:flavin-dependent dehydrogenase
MQTQGAGQSRPIDSILIVGGGTAGWLTAAYLRRVIDKIPGAPVEITLVESEEIGTIGVGEATVITLRDMMKALGVAEGRFLKQCDATFKHGIRFRGWRNGETNDHFFHSFEAPSLGDGFSITQHWVAARLRGEETEPFDCAVGVQATLAEGGRAPKLWNSPGYEAPVAYAYHLDAGLFARLLQEVAIGAGVRRIQDTVVRVEAEGDRILAVHTRARGPLTADLYIDCSGFRSLLLGAALGEPLVDYAKALPCDRAVALRIPHAPDAPLRPFTTATAAESGWIWDLDLQSRRGTGHVYASAFTTAEDAERRLRAYVGRAAEGCPALHLRAPAGRRRRLWVGNCVGVGLAGGFIEPLESSGIYLVETGLRLLFDHLPAALPSPPLADQYNRLMADLYDEVRDFVAMHYCTTARRDSPFWRYQADGGQVPDSLARRLALWRHKIPAPSDVISNVCLFGYANYTFILAGMGWLPDDFPGARFIDAGRSRKLFDQMKDIRRRALALSPPHRDVVQRLAAAA